MEVFMIICHHLMHNNGTVLLHIQFNQIISWLKWFLLKQLLWQAEVGGKCCIADNKWLDCAIKKVAISDTYMYKAWITPGIHCKWRDCERNVKYLVYCISMLTPMIVKITLSKRAPLHPVSNSTGTAKGSIFGLLVRTFATTYMVLTRREDNGENHQQNGLYYTICHG